MPPVPPAQTDLDPHDRIALAGTGLRIAIERDLTIAGAVARTGWAGDSVDTVITDAVIIDYWGIVRADIGIRGGRIAGIGRAGADMLVSPGTKVIPADDRIVTAGLIDVRPRRLARDGTASALASGVTTMLCDSIDPGATLADTAGWPVNLVIAVPDGATAASRLGAGPGALVLDAANIAHGLDTAEGFDVQALLDRAEVPGIVDALGARTVHVLLDRDASGITSLAAPLNLLISAPADAALIDLLHDIGAISMLRADRLDNLAATLWQAASRMKASRGPLPEDAATGHDNFRVKRYLAKSTINPAIAHGLDEWTGAIGNGLLADLVLWRPETFGIRPDLVLKGGVAVTADDARPPAVTFVAQAALSRAVPIDTVRRLLPVNHTRGITRESMIHNAATPSIEPTAGSGVLRVDGESIPTR